MNIADKKTVTFVGVGEVLYDVFEDGTATLGGAPLNVAVHAHQLASTLGLGEAVVVSRVGDDPHGRGIVQSLKTRGMRVEYVQMDANHPTGSVSVFLHGSEPGYQIDAGVAWDFLEKSERLDDLAASCDAICFGSLAQRSPNSRETIRRFLSMAPGAVRLYDVNLRRNSVTKEPGYSAEVIEESCQLATVMKVNCIELLEICGIFGIGPCGSFEVEGLRKTADRFLNHFPVEALVVTRGPEGTSLFTGEGEFNGHAIPGALEKVYPVGAGDACAAGMLFACVFGWQPDDAIHLANRMGTWVASQLSATPPLPDSILMYAREAMQSQNSIGMRPTGMRSR